MKLFYAVCALMLLFAVGFGIARIDARLKQLAEAFQRVAAAQEVHDLLRAESK